LLALQLKIINLKNKNLESNYKTCSCFFYTISKKASNNFEKRNSIARKNTSPAIHSYLFKWLFTKKSTLPKKDFHCCDKGGGAITDFQKKTNKL